MAVQRWLRRRSRAAALRALQALRTPVCPRHPLARARHQLAFARQELRAGREPGWMMLVQRQAIALAVRALQRRRRRGPAGGAHAAAARGGFGASAVLRAATLPFWVAASRGKPGLGRAGYAAFARRLSRALDPSFGDDSAQFISQLKQGWSRDSGGGKGRVGYEALHAHLCQLAHAWSGEGAGDEQLARFLDQLGQAMGLRRPGRPRSPPVWAAGDARQGGSIFALWAKEGGPPMPSRPPAPEGGSMLGRRQLEHVPRLAQSRTRTTGPLGPATTELRPTDVLPQFCAPRRSPAAGSAFTVLRQMRNRRVPGRGAPFGSPRANSQRGGRRD